jgi:hypothetical protein
MNRRLSRPSSFIPYTPVGPDVHRALSPHAMVATVLHARRFRRRGDNHRRDHGRNELRLGPHRPPLTRVVGPGGQLVHLASPVDAKPRKGASDEVVAGELVFSRDDRQRHRIEKAAHYTDANAESVHRHDASERNGKSMAAAVVVSGVRGCRYLNSGLSRVQTADTHRSAAANKSRHGATTAACQP